MSTPLLPDFSQVRPDAKTDNVKQMLTVTEDGGCRTVRINSSSLGIILSCPRKSYYLLHRNLRSKSESPALTFGTAIHKALEVFYSWPKAERSIPITFKETSNRMAFAPVESWPTDHFLYKAIAAFIQAGSSLQMLPDSDKRSIPNGIWLLQHYFETYINDPYVVYSDANGPVTERTFELPLMEHPRLKIILFGTIDVVLRSELSGTILAADHKTSSVIGHDFFSRLKPNHQYTGYLMGAQQVLGLKTDSFLVNALQVKPKPVTARGTGPHFTRQITTRTPEDIIEFKDTVQWAVSSFLAWRDTNQWPLGDVNACTQWGGCSFLEVCGAPQQLRNNLLEAKYASPIGN